MSITSLTPRERGEERQSPLVGMVELSGADLQDGAIDLFDMPNKAMILDISLLVSGAFDAGATLDVGTESDPDAFLDGVALDSTGKTASSSLPLTTGSGETITATPSGVTTNAGACTVIVQYVVADRACSTQG